MWRWECVSQPFGSSIAAAQVKISLKNELKAPIRWSICQIRLDLNTGLKGFKLGEHDSFAWFLSADKRQEKEKKTDVKTDQGWAQSSVWGDSI